MKGYLGEFDVTDQRDISKDTVIKKLIFKYGGIGGEHHKDWLLDQIARIVNNAPITIVEARWDNGHCEDRIKIGNCGEYQRWVEYVKDAEDGPDIYEYNVGIPP